MNRKLWNKKNFLGKDFSIIPCPKCFLGTLVGKENFSKVTPSGIEMEKLGYPYGIENLFVGILECNNQNCKNIISVNGYLNTNISVGIELPNGEWKEDYISNYEPKFFLPNLRFFDLNHKDIPNQIKAQIDSSFSLYYTDTAACANKIRTSIELILDNLNAPISHRGKTNKLSKFKSLHQRIENFKKRKPHICKLLLALKVVGNEGSHNEKVNNEDVLDAFEILEQVIEELYIKNKQRIVSIAEKIITK